MSVGIPNSVTEIEKYAFAGCKSLKSLTIPDSVTHIGAGAFQDCASLPSLEIPDSVMRIGRSAFDGCTELTLIVPTRLFGRHIGVGCKMVSKEIVDAARASGDALASRVGP